MAISDATGKVVQTRVAQPAAPPFQLLDLPPELRQTVYEFALTTCTGRIFLFEEHGKLRIGMTAGGIMPAGGFNEGFASWTRHNIELPKPYNQLQYVSR